MLLRQRNVVIDHVVQHAASAVDIVNLAVLGKHRINTSKITPLVTLGRVVTDDFEVVRRIRRLESNGHSTRETNRRVK